jgi:hypothetical protein
VHQPLFNKAQAQQNLCVPSLTSVNKRQQKMKTTGPRQYRVEKNQSRVRPKLKPFSSHPKPTSLNKISRKEV